MTKIPKGLPTAKEANKLAKKVTTEAQAEQMRLVQGKIKQAIMDNKLFISLSDASFGDLTVQTKAWLKSKGYKVTSVGGDDRDPESYTTISWELA